MQVGRRTRATAQAVAARVDAAIGVLRALVVAVVTLTLAVVVLAVRA